MNLSLSRLFARSIKGQRAYGQRPSKRGKNVSIIGAVFVNKVLTNYTALGGIHGLTFEAFISQKLVPQLWEGACVVMDNLSSHKVKKIKELIEGAGAQLIYLPTYSPEFNPIENCWSKLKSILRQIAARTYSDLASAIEYAIDQISSEDLRNWFTHCCYCTSPG